VETNSITLYHSEELVTYLFEVNLVLVVLNAEQIFSRTFQGHVSAHHGFHDRSHQSERRAKTNRIVGGPIFPCGSRTSKPNTL
jgi:hypothetical protein